MVSLRTSIIIGVMISMVIVTVGLFATQFLGYFGAGPNADPRQSTELGSRLNPAPVNTTITYTPITARYIGKRAVNYYSSFWGSTMNVTMLEVIKGDEANRIMKEAGERPLNPNNDFVMARFKVEMLDDRRNHTYPLGSFDFKASDNTGTILYDTHGYYAPYLDADLRKGESAEGWIAVEYDRSNTVPMIVFDHFDDNSIGLWFKTTE